MTIELSHFALILALSVALIQATIPLLGAKYKQGGLMQLADTTAVAQFALVALAFAALVDAYVTSDFSVLTVAENSTRTMPLLYKFTGVWGNHEGSMLLWVLILSLFGAGVAWFGDNLPPTLKARVLAVQGMIGLGFYLFILLTSDPFRRIYPAPLEGSGLNPLLQDPGLAFHPPMLYLGYVGLSVPFSFAVGALIEGKVDAAWARWVRPWTLAAWCALTVGIAMGSWWAYYSLGWGGWWFWDPVENASFMPWLVATALLHSAIVVEKRDALKSWTVLLAIVAFSLSLVGTFLVRSGVLTSVHAFAVDPRRGIFILILIGIAIGGSLLLYALRAPGLAGGGLFAPISREGALVLNNVLLAAGAATVFLGTLYPLFLDAVGGPKLSVGYPFFDRTFVPLMVPLLTAIAAGPFLAWKRGDLGAALQYLWTALVLTLLAGATLLYVTKGGPILAVGGLMLAAWTFLGALSELAERTKLFRIRLADSWRRAMHLPRASHGMTLAHIGLAVTVAGIAASAWQVQDIMVMKPGSNLEIGGYTLHLDRLEHVTTPTYEAARADVRVSANGHPVALMRPEQRTYPVEQMSRGETAIHTNFVADLYLALGHEDGKGGVTIRAYWKPLAPWIWMGAIFMAFGGLLSLSDRRFRIGVARRCRVPDAAVQPGE